ncbi:MAG TPA: hypothetical protein VGT03_11070 [Candidatus Acidoferrales bacterium]|nr:hypothetical protein [Candidatus Acidoferrales bacterium]
MIGSMRPAYGDTWQSRLASESWPLIYRTIILMARKGHGFSQTICHDFEKFSTGMTQVPTAPENAKALRQFPPRPELL